MAGAEDDEVDPEEDPAEADPSEEDEPPDVDPPDDPPEDEPDGPLDGELGASLGACRPSWPAPAGVGSCAEVLCEVLAREDVEPVEVALCALAPSVRPGAIAATSPATAAVRAAVPPMIQRRARATRISAASRMSWAEDPLADRGRGGVRSSSGIGTDIGRPG